MINEVRNTVLEIINKENNGYITPAEFNDFARVAQLDIFNEMFYDYAKSVEKRNNRRYNTGHGDIPKLIAEEINFFTTDVVLTYNVTTLRFTLPTDVYSNGTVLTLAGNEVEYVPQSKILNLVNVPDIAPTETYPVHTTFGNEIRVYPNTLNAAGQILMNYIREPADPKWTWVTLTDGEPVFDQGAGDYQDFELSKSYEFSLIMKICQMAGVSIREEQVVQYAKSEEMQQNQDEQ